MHSSYSAMEVTVFVWIDLMTAKTQSEKDKELWENASSGAFDHAFFECWDDLHCLVRLSQWWSIVACWLFVKLSVKTSVHFTGRAGARSHLRRRWDLTTVSIKELLWRSAWAFHHTSHFTSSPLKMVLILLLLVTSHFLGSVYVRALLLAWSLNFS